MSHCQPRDFIRAVYIHHNTKVMNPLREIHSSDQTLREAFYCRTYNQHGVDPHVLTNCGWQRGPQNQFSILNGLWNYTCDFLEVYTNTSISSLANKVIKVTSGENQLRRSIMSGSYSCSMALAYGHELSSAVSYLSWKCYITVKIMPWRHSQCCFVFLFLLSFHWLIWHWYWALYWHLLTWIMQSLLVNDAIVEASCLQPYFFPMIYLYYP